MYILQKCNKALALYRNDTYYVIGFKNITSTRYVMQNVNKNTPVIHLVKENNLVIQKNVVEIPVQPDLDNITLKYVDHDEFYMYPYKHMMGVVVTNEIEDEDTDSITLRCHVFDPFFEVEISRKSLDAQYNI